MNWNDYEVVWKRQQLPLGARADVAELRQSFETKSRRLTASLRVRDWSEIVACGIVLAAYGQFWRKIGPAAWPMAGAMLLIIGVAVFFLRERLRRRRCQLGADAPLLAKVGADLAELHHQRRLLRKVWAWYLAPCLGAMLIHLGVMVRVAKPWSPLREPLFLLAALLGVAATCAFAWWINWRALRQRIEPRIAELEKLHDDLRSTP